MRELEAQLRAYGSVLDAAESDLNEVSEATPRRVRRGTLVALAALVVVAIVAAVAGVVATRSSSPRRPNIVSPASTTAPTNPPKPTTTSPAIPVIPAGAVMLQSSGRKIFAVGANGHALDTLVTAFAGREVTDSAFAADHETIWYATQAEDNQSCPEVVKLNLLTNVRTVVAHAEDFTLSPDGRRVLLVWPKNDAAVNANCAVTVQKQYDDALVVRDLATGAQSSLPASEFPTAGTGGPSGPVWMSPAGDRLITTQCVFDGCSTLLWTVPRNLDGPIQPSAAAGPACGCSRLLTGQGGMYAIDEGTSADPQTRLRRYDLTNLAGPGTVLVESKSVRLSTVVPTSAGLFVLGSPGGLYRVDNGLLRLIGPIDAPPQTTTFPAPTTYSPI